MVKTMTETDRVRFSGHGDARPASLGDFEPHALVFLGSGPRQEIWAVARLRSQTPDRSGRPPLGQGAMYPRESFALAWLLLKRGLRAMLSSITDYALKRASA